MRREVIVAPTEPAEAATAAPAQQAESAGLNAEPATDRSDVQMTHQAEASGVALPSLPENPAPTTQHPGSLGPSNAAQQTLLGKRSTDESPGSASKRLKASVADPETTPADHPSAAAAPAQHAESQTEPPTDLQKNEHQLKDTAQQREDSTLSALTALNAPLGSGQAPHEQEHSQLPAASATGAQQAQQQGAAAAPAPAEGSAAESDKPVQPIAAQPGVLTCGICFEPVQGRFWVSEHRAPCCCGRSCCTANQNTKLACRGSLPCFPLAMAPAFKILEGP